MRRPPSIALWVDDLPMPPLRTSWELRGDGREALFASFAIALPDERAARDDALGHGGQPFAGVALVRLPAGRDVEALLAPTEAQAPLSSFVYRRTLAVVIDGLRPGASASLSVVLAARTTPAPRAPPHAARRLRAFGHRFVLAKHRLPCVSELVAGVGTPEPELRSLLHASRSPTCAEDVRLGALPRIVLPLDEAALRARFEIPTRVEAPLEGVEQVFEVTRERVRPISVAALRRLRHPGVSARLRAFLDESPSPAPPRGRRRG